MKISLTNKIISSFLVWSCLLSAAKSQSAVCSDKCTDYHRLCLAINNEAYYSQYVMDVENGLVDQYANEMPPQPDCNQGFYNYACPYTCGKCTPCFVSKIEAIHTKISTLEAEVSSLFDTLNELTDKVSTLMVIPIKTALSSEVFNNKYVLPNSFDGGLKTNIEYCFHSKDNKNGWAEYEIPAAKVMSVSVLNRKSKGAAKRLEGARVEVCALRGGCSQICGIFGSVAASSWGHVQCPGGGIEGKYVRIVNPGNFLQICEVEINGNIIPDMSLKSASIVSATSSQEFNNKYVLSNSYDGGLKTYIDYCFHSKDKKNGWAEYQIQSSTVRFVGVLNRQSKGSAKRLEGARVEVCQQSGGCSSVCGTFPDVAASSWGYVECPGGGIQGSYIRVVNPSEFLQICEMDILLA